MPLNMYIHVIDFVRRHVVPFGPRGSRVDEPPAHRSISCAALWLHSVVVIFQAVGFLDLKRF
jgi:hypothetical protein